MKGARRAGRPTPPGEPESPKTENDIVQAFLIELANGSYGYLPPPNQVELGGYETWLGKSRFEKHSPEVLAKELLEILGELWEGWVGCGRVEERLVE